MDLIFYVSVFICMYIETDIRAYDYWNNLSKDDRLKLLQEHCFWDGFSQYLWDYLPEPLKLIITLKININ
jgi:hypothetical protein